VMCNQEIKFKLFYDIAISQGADFIATGHYAISEDGNLKLATDTNKDQTYFLYRISDEAISQTLFPLGKMLKPEVKQLAAEFGLDNAYKKESMGVCFVGEVGIKDFLQEYIEVTPGQIIDRDTNRVLGTHEGAVFYTIGQRHGLNLGGGLPYYVVGKDMAKNQVFVSKNLNHLNLWTKTLKLKDVMIRQIHQESGDIQPNLSKLTCRVRHRAPLINCSFNTETNEVILAEEIKHPAAGQSVVFYAGDVCIGGGIIAE
jgi:tRNA (5-methylaminomethyl-2-thiouridylate)-methyltransferase